MSLLDDVSIVVTPNGYKAGELYAVVPVPTEGADVIINGDFDGGTTDWNLGNAVWQQGSGNGEVKLTKPSSGNAVIYQTGLSFAANTVLRYRFNIVDYSGLVSVRIDGYSGSNPINTPLSFTASEGNVDVYVTTDRVGSSVFLYLTGGSTGDYVVLDNVSVKVWTGADMDVTRATAATRVDENGLVNYAEILGSEEITNGDFVTDLSGWTTSGTNATNTITWETNGARIISTGTNIGLFQNTLIIGKTYKLTCDVAITVGKIGLDGATSGSTVNMVEGFNEIIFTAISTTFKIKRITGNDNCLLDNVSVKEVTRDNVPRIDYTGGGCPHILAEPQRTNVFIQNDISTWDGFSSYADETTAPDGTTIDFVNMEDRRIFPTTTISNSTEYTSSIYLKGNKTADVKVRSTAANDTVITLSTEWQRFELTATSVSTVTNALLIDARYGQGMGAAGLEIAIYGAQLEEGSYATSYIPTSGSTVTRNQDIFTRDGIGSLINSTEGVLFAEMAALGDDGTIRYLSVNDGSSNNRVTLLYYSSSTNIRVIVSSGGTNYVDKNSGVSSILDFHKVAIKWKVDDFALWIDGIKVQTDTSGLVPIGLNTLSLDVAGSGNFYGKVKQLQVYDTALTDTQLAALTS